MSRSNRPPGWSGGPNPPHGRMAAGSGDPWIGVHVLTEFIFCPRAGLIASEQQQDEEEEEETPFKQRLDYTPTYYSGRQIEAALEHASAWAKPLGLGFALALGTAAIAYALGAPRVAVAAAVVAAVVGRFLWAYLVRIFKLAGQHRQMRQAVPDDPQHDPSLAGGGTPPVNWWSLLKADYESIAYKDALRDERWRLAGRPWRVLRKGSLRIPVFRMTRYDPSRQRQLYDQHYARMAAYCHLLEHSEGAESPFGIIVYGKTYNGVAIPNVPRWRKRFHDGLVEARRVVQNAESRGLDPPPPNRSGICVNCPIGKPFVDDGGENELKRHGIPVPVFGRDGDDRRTYHSACGDRFRWVPPHVKARDKGL